MAQAADFGQIGRALHQVESGMDPAECHGYVCGLLCTQPDMADAAVLEAACPAADPRNLLFQDARAALLALIGATHQQLQEAQADFQPLLPGDDSALEERIEALGHWCQGFLSGLAQGGVVELDKLPDDLPEMVNDLVEISRAASFELSGEEEEDEAAYAELVEYVRVGVMLMYEDLRPQGGEAPVLH